MTKSQAARKQMRYRDRLRRTRVEAQNHLDRTGHTAFNVQMVKATIGQPYQSARMGEALITYKRGAPILLPLAYVARLKVIIGREHTDGDVLRRITHAAKAYKVRRKPTKNRTWRG